MTTATTTTASSSTTTAATSVVKNDTATAGTKINATAFQTAYDVLEQLTVERQVWEDNVLRTSNEHLYALLQKCYQFYFDMCADTEHGKALRTGLNDYVEVKGYKNLKASHSLNKIVKCVFGVDRRRVSAYSIALQFALSKNTAARDLPSFIYENGGVEQMRLAKSPTAVSPMQKAEIATRSLASQRLAVVDGKAFATKFDGGKIGQQIVLIGTWQADGSVVVQGVVQSDGVVNAALASYYSSGKAEEQKKLAEVKAANDRNAKLSAINNAAQAA
jgi:hypothetical protein